MTQEKNSEFTLFPPDLKMIRQSPCTTTLYIDESDKTKIQHAYIAVNLENIESEDHLMQCLNHHIESIALSSLAESESKDNIKLIKLISNGEIQKGMKLRIVEDLLSRDTQIEPTKSK